jgi:hypothetical protein
LDIKATIAPHTMSQVAAPFMILRMPFKMTVFYALSTLLGFSNLDYATATVKMPQPTTSSFSGFNSSQQASLTLKLHLHSWFWTISRLMPWSVKPQQ